MIFQWIGETPWWDLGTIFSRLARERMWTVYDNLVKRGSLREIIRKKKTCNICSVYIAYISHFCTLEENICVGTKNRKDLTAQNVGKSPNI